MSSIEVVGGEQLKGDLKIQGSKKRSIAYYCCYYFE